MGELLFIDSWAPALDCIALDLYQKEVSEADTMILFGRHLDGLSDV